MLILHFVTPMVLLNVLVLNQLYIFVTLNGASFTATES